jgi:hypothetical protein
MSGDFGLAERLLRAFVEADSHCPRALTLFSLALLAQNKSAAALIEQTTVEIADSNWANGFLVATRDVRAECQTAIDKFLARYPEEAERVEPLANAIESVENSR